MRNDPTRGRRLKHELPYPYDQDLSKVLRGLKRRNPITRRSRQANDPVTAAYLPAAVRLIQRPLGPGASRLPGDADDADSIERPLLGFLSRRAVAAEVSHNPPPFHRVGRISTMRERWRHQSDFVADVLRFGLWASHYPASHQDEAADARDEVIGGPDPVRGVHRMCYWDMNKLLGAPMFRLGSSRPRRPKVIWSSPRRCPSVTRKTTRCGSAAVLALIAGCVPQPRGRGDR